MSDAPSRLCDNCGLCCDGTLFESVAVEAAEVSELEHRRLPLVDTADGTKHLLPCDALDGVLCAIYEQRPRRCRSFECELLRDVQSGRLTSSYARRVIDEVRLRRRRVKAALPDGISWWAALARLRRADTKGALREDLSRLEHLVRLRFWQ